MTCGCFVEEREALMDIRASLTRANATAPPSWGRGDDCCSWERVKCSSSTRRVTHLYLSNLYECDYTKVLTGGAVPWRFNISIFSAFTDLQFLDLSSIWYLDLGSNGLAGLKLPKLQHLNLSRNWWEESIISLAPLGELVLLEVLDVSVNNIQQALPTAVLENLTNVRELYLSGDISNDIFNTSNLMALDMRSNHSKLV
ncbi:hypothetical protein GUJ93_ZPchr0458g22493 [Zizania palustris]|uniref:Leucine-rich repeat-containing N-terminal plant-type domain-containing protein n=1 Tax=Zizania palustris TaxID=103762 RepID=A0A8J5UUS7_ZIZPA|nr:hypothetical protein GUJ93_ZPchr0458g22493 [Zizania palustris]